MKLCTRELLISDYINILYVSQPPFFRRFESTIVVALLTFVWRRKKGSETNVTILQHITMYRNYKERIKWTIFEFIAHKTHTIFSRFGSFHFCITSLHKIPFIFIGLSFLSRERFLFQNAANDARSVFHSTAKTDFFSQNEYVWTYF